LWRADFVAGGFCGGRILWRADFVAGGLKS